MTLPRLTFVLGGARSGKSAYAESLLAGSSHRAYIATAQAFDQEMAARIAQHRLDRGEDWRTIDAPIDLCAAIGSLDGAAALLDCVTVWIGNLMHEERDVSAEIGDVESQLAAEQEVLAMARARWQQSSEDVERFTVEREEWMRRRESLRVSLDELRSAAHGRSHRVGGRFGQVPSRTEG